MKTKLFLILTLFSFRSFANYIEYYNQINEGEYQMYLGNYDLAVANYLIAFDFVDQPHTRDLYYTTKCYAQLQNDENFYHYLDLSIKNGLKPYQINIDSLWFTMYWAEPKFKSIITQNIKVLPLKIDSSYLSQLQSLWLTFNQFSYSMEDSVKTHFDSTSIEYQSFFEAKNKNHKQVETAFFNLMLNNELPNLIEDNYAIFRPYNMKPSMVIIRLFFMYLRTNSIHFNTIKNKLFNSLNSGKITPLQYAYMIDWCLKFSGEKVKYGISINSIPEKNINEFIENRKEIGLSRYYATAPAYSKYYLSEDITYNFISE